MKKTGMGLALCLMTFVHAEQVICLDEDLINQEIAGIMRSRGVEPFPYEVAQMRGLMHAICKSAYHRNKSRKKFFNPIPIRSLVSLHSLSSLADLYQHGFLCLQAGRWQEAYDAWALVALRYPKSDADEQIIKMAMNFVMHGREHLFPVLKIKKADNVNAASLMIVPPMASSTLLAAFLVG